MPYFEFADGLLPRIGNGNIIKLKLSDKLVGSKDKLKFVRQDASGRECLLLTLTLRVCSNRKGTKRWTRMS